MTVGLYDTAVLNRVVETTVQPQSFFLSNYFGQVETSESETIMFDTTTERRRITPFVSPLVQGKVIQGQGYATKSFSPAYLKDKRVFDPNKSFRRLAGERIGGSLTPAQRLQANVAWALGDQVKMFNRRMEVMAAEALRRGALTISGDDYPTVNLDFARDASLTVTLSGGARWGQAGVKPLATLEDLAEVVFAKSGVYAKDVVMTLDVWKVLRADADFLAQLSTLRRDLANSAAYVGPAVQGIDNVRFVGTVGEFNFYVYSGKYVDPVDNAEKDILPAGTVLLLSDQAEGVQHYGAIRDLKAGIQPRQYFVKSWEEEDPSVRYFLMQSAPLVVPYRVNATASMTVL